MTVEIIALVEKNYGQKVLEEMKSSPGVLQILNAAGRSSDLFEDKQFGTFGEAAIVTIVADDKQKDKIFKEVYNLCDLKNNNNLPDQIENTSGSITWSLDSKSFFYSKLDKFHRPRKIYQHILGTKIENDILIFEENDETFTCGISLTSDEKYFIITSSDHNTSEQYYFEVDENNPNPKLIQTRKRGIIYSINSWDDYFYKHTNENAEDFKIDRCNNLVENKWEPFIKAKDEVLIGGLVFLNNWIIRSETSNALGKIILRDPKSNNEILLFKSPAPAVPVRVVRTRPVAWKLRNHCRRNL